MKRYIALGWCAFLSLMVATECLAAQYTGRVTDANGLPLPFVSVYVKDNPYVGTVTADDGTFTLDIPAEDGAGELVFSFIGFRTVEMPLPGLRTDTPVAVTLEEQPILLDGTEVSAKASWNGCGTTSRKSAPPGTTSSPGTRGRRTTANCCATR